MQSADKIFLILGILLFCEIINEQTASHGSKVLECSFVYNEMAQTVNNELRCKGYPYLQLGVYTGVSAAADNPKHCH